MKFLKSAYVSSYLLAAVAGTAVSAVALFHAGRLDSPWLGSLLACLPQAALFVRLFAAPIARTSRNLPWMLSLGAAGTVLAAALARGPHPAIAVAFGVGVAGSMLYVFWYSRFSARDRSVLAAGNILPDFPLEDADGNAISSTAFRGQPAVWMFYRGNWCPLCMAQIREVAAAYRDIARRGAEVLLVSPQPPAYTRQLARKFDVPMHFLVDRENRAARRLGVFAENGLPAGLQALGYDSDVPMPTVFITDAEGRILHSDLTDNYRVRPEPQEFLTVLDRAGI